MELVACVDHTEDHLQNIPALLKHCASAVLGETADSAPAVLFLSVVPRRLHAHAASVLSLDGLS